MNMKQIAIILTSLATLTACTQKAEKSDAYGNFEAKEIIISAEAQGKLLSFIPEEGQKLQAGQLVGLVDTMQLHYTRAQLIAKKNAIATKTGGIFSQIRVQEEQIKTLERERERVKKLLEDGAATEKQLDDINSKIDVLRRQIESIRSQNSTVTGEMKAIDEQIAQVEDRLAKCRIVNPISGVVLEKYIEPFEIAVPGKALYKIANLDEMELRVYVSGAQLDEVKLGQEAEVLIDKNEEEYTKLTGTVSWVSSEAEFTPKIIQTKEERVSMVYAVKLRVKNDGTLKIGMPGEVNF
jgi:HlyD family secretion protein